MRGLPQSAEASIAAKAEGQIAEVSCGLGDQIEGSAVLRIPRRAGEAAPVLKAAAETLNQCSISTRCCVGVIVLRGQLRCRLQSNGGRGGWAERIGVLLPRLHRLPGLSRGFECARELGQYLLATVGVGVQ